MAYPPDRTLLRLLPSVLRARDFHLYLEGGKRLTDLWRAGGKAVLGHKPPRVLGELKNAAERGLFTSLPHPLERRFIKALGEFFPGRAFRLYSDDSSLQRALEGAGFTGPFSDPAFPSRDDAARNSVTLTGGKPGVSLWRPFLEPSSDTVPYGLLIPILPWPLGPSVLVLEKSMEASFPPGELIPPVLLAPAARSLYDLAAVMKTSGNGPSYPKITKALAGQKPEDAPAGTLAGMLWERRGIYITATAMNREKYEALFRRFLEGGFLIPPSQEEPLILPLSMSPGEESKLSELLGAELLVDKNNLTMLR